MVRTGEERFADLPGFPWEPRYCAEAGQRAWTALKGDGRPMLVLWGAEDPVLPIAGGQTLAAALGVAPPEPIARASQDVQEDAGEEVGRRVAGWLREQSY